MRWVSDGCAWLTFGTKIVFFTTPPSYNHQLEMNNKGLQDFPDHIYIERPGLVEEIRTRLRRDYVVALLGSSGVGKSMVIDGGLLPFLEAGKMDGRAGPRWRIVKTQPLADPIGNLAEALAKPGALYADAKEISLRTKLEGQLRNSADAIQQIYIEAASNAPSEPFNLLLIVDQLQDLKRYNSLLAEPGKAPVPGYGQKGDDVTFVSLLLSAAGSSLPIYLIFISDSNYLEHYARYQGLPEAMSQFRCPVDNIPAREIEAALCGLMTDENMPYDVPATVAGRTQYYQAKVNADPSDAVSRQKIAELAYVEKLLDDYKDLLGESATLTARDKNEPDPYAVQKFNLFRILTLQAWKNAQQDSRQLVPPLSVYNQHGPMRDIVDHYADKIVYPQLEPEVCAKFFKGLTSVGGENQWLAQAVPVRKLQGYCGLVAFRKEPPPPQIIEPSFKPDGLLRMFRYYMGKEDATPLLNGTSAGDTPVQKPSPADFQKIIDAFNHTGVRFIGRFGTADISSDSIVDINSNSLLLNWDRLGVWIEAERTHANVYQNLYRDAIKYYSYAPNKPEAASGKPALYEGGTLINARNWETECRPTEDWAARYPASVVSKNQVQAAPVKIHGKPAEQLGEFGVAMEFLQESKEAGNRIENEKLQNLQKAIYGKWRANIFSGFFLIIVLLAGYLWDDANMQKRNLVMRSFVELLAYNDVLNIPAGSRFNIMQVIKQKIEQNRSIDSEEEVLDLLAEMNILQQDKALKPLNDKALLNLEQLNMTMLNGGEPDKIKAGLDKIYQQYQAYKAQQPAGFFQQNPPLYNTIYAHVDAKETGFRIVVYPDDSLKVETTLHPNCLAATPGNPKYYVFGDRNGIVFLKEGENDPQPLFSVGAPITCLMYNRDGSAYYIGTESGAIYRSRQVDYFTGKQPDLVYQNPSGKAIYFAGECEGGQKLLVRAYKSLFFLQINATTGKYLPSGNTLEIPLESVSSCAWNSDQNWLIATGKDSSIVYKIDAGNAFDQQRLVKKNAIQHMRRTISRLDLKTGTDKNGNPSLWVALGGMGGMVFIGNIQVEELDHSDIDVFHHDDIFYYEHDAPVSGLTFNPGLPQLASCSEEGEIVLCNLLQPGEDVDKIRIHNQVQGLTSLAYLDNDNLVVYENSTSWILKTNIEALWQKLECLYKNCQ